MTIATVGARDTSTVATLPHHSDRLSDISDLLLLAPIVAMGAVMSEARCYCGGMWHGRGCY
jgi:hypothetical protein